MAKSKLVISSGELVIVRGELGGEMIVSATEELVDIIKELGEMTSEYSWLGNVHQVDSPGLWKFVGEYNPEANIFKGVFTKIRDTI